MNHLKVKIFVYIKNNNNNKNSINMKIDNINMFPHRSEKKTKPNRHVSKNT